MSFMFPGSYKSLGFTFSFVSPRVVVAAVCIGRDKSPIQGYVCSDLTSENNGSLFSFPRVQNPLAVTHPDEANVQEDGGQQREERRTLAASL